MKKLLFILSFFVVHGCATTSNYQPYVPPSEMKRTSLTLSILLIFAGGVWKL